ncbi:Glutamyl-tRNA(Gln) amidotransferase subunit A [Hordeum vulgare]|nr:Glutamyl-tRNA(Gln) amidotransferase subunit A [Hordeum vulgare]
MNFHDVYTREQAQVVAPPPRLITNQAREDHRRRQRRLLIVEEDERAMVEWRWRYPEDVAAKNAFWMERTANCRAEREDRRWRKALAILQCDLVNAGGKSFFGIDDERWDDIWLDTSDTEDDDDDEDDSE